MKKYHFFLLVIFNFHFLYAQVILDKKMIPKVGQCFELNKFKMDFKQFKLFNQYDKVNFVWNFAKYPVRLLQTDTLCIIDAEKTPYAKLFPTANLAITTPSKIEYDYYYFNENGFDMEGNVSLKEDGVSICIATDPPLEVAFPTKMNDWQQDDFKWENIKYILETDSVTYNRYNFQSIGEKKYVAANYGSLILPNKQSFPVLCLGKNSNEESFLTNEEGTLNEEKSTISIAWFSPNQLVPVLWVDVTCQKDSIFGCYEMPVASNILKNKKKYPFNVWLYPDKQDNKKMKVEFLLEKAADIHLSIVNIYGEEVYQKTFKGLNAGVQVQKLDISAFTTGNYMLSIQTDENVEEFWFAKI